MKEYSRSTRKMASESRMEKVCEDAVTKGGVFSQTFNHRHHFVPSYTTSTGGDAALDGVRAMGGMSLLM